MRMVVTADLMRDKEEYNLTAYLTIAFTNTRVKHANQSFQLAPKL